MRIDKENIRGFVDVRHNCTLSEFVEYILQVSKYFGGCESFTENDIFKILVDLESEEGFEYRLMRLPFTYNVRSSNKDSNEWCIVSAKDYNLGLPLGRFFILL